MYELTEGKIEFTRANEVVRKMFYLSRSRLYAIEYADILNQIIGNNPNYTPVIEYIKVID